MRLFDDKFKELKRAGEPRYRSPKSVQETIEIRNISESGIFELERGHFSKSYLFEDINYVTTNDEEQIDIFERYCRLLNSLDVTFKITINNKNKDMVHLKE